MGHSWLWALLTRPSVGTAYARKRQEEGTAEGNSCRCRGHPGLWRPGLTSCPGKWRQTPAMQRVRGHCPSTPSCYSSRAILTCPALLCAQSWAQQVTYDL